MVSGVRVSSTRSIALLGATGSIGSSTLDILRLNSGRYRLYAVSGFNNIKKLFEICQEFCPSYAVIGDAWVQELQAKCQTANLTTKILPSSTGLEEIASTNEVDTVVAAIVGAAGLSSTLAAVKAGKKVLLANKEALVMAGDLVMMSAQKSGASILPIDSEHNAIFQCLPPSVQENSSQIKTPSFGIKKLWLTASGGAFLHKSYEAMASASVREAVAHPNWSMGQKISVDSATMMNKGLELIEACHLFSVSVEDVGVVIHPQSLVHSLVEYVDGSFLAQMGSPDMRTPIGYALAYPQRINTNVQTLNLFDCSKLEFIAPDEQKFACLALAKKAMRLGNGACIVLNAANEVAVEAFLAEQIALTDIAKVVGACLDSHLLKDKLEQSYTSLDVILALDKEARHLAKSLLTS